MLHEAPLHLYHIKIHERHSTASLQEKNNTAENASPASKSSGFDLYNKSDMLILLFI